MKNLIYIVLIAVFIIGCNASKSVISSPNKDLASNVITKNDTVRIANDSLEYEIIITDPGFNLFLNSVAKPRNYYSIGYLENRNMFLVGEYNRRVLEPFRYNPDLYEMRIDYQSNIRYGYEVNYLLYNYFLFFQKTYKQKL